MGRFDDLELQRTLGGKELQIFNAEMQRQHRSVILTYFLWFVLGWAGVHKFYVGETLQGASYALLSIGGSIVMLLDPGSRLLLRGDVPFVFGIMLILGVTAVLIWGLLMLWDLFTIPRQIARRETKIRRVLLERLASPS